MVSTAVGGVPEVLPKEFIRLAPARAPEMAVCIANAVTEVMQHRPTRGPSANSDKTINQVSKKFCHPLHQVATRPRS